MCQLLLLPPELLPSLRPAPKPASSLMLRLLLSPRRWSTAEVNPEATVSVSSETTRPFLVAPARECEDEVPVREDLLPSAADAILESPVPLVLRFCVRDDNLELIGGRPSLVGDVFPRTGRLSSTLYACTFQNDNSGMIDSLANRADHKTGA